MNRVRNRLTDATVVAVMALFLAMGEVALVSARGVAPPPPPDKTTGKVGAFGWDEDSEASPAGSCRYGVTIDGSYFNYLHRVGVDAPNAYARPNQTTQRIGFRLTLQHFDGDRWVTGKHTDWSIKTATPSDPAPFGARALKFRAAPGDTPSRRAKVQLRWYGRDGHKVKGTATMFPDWYEATEQGAKHAQDERCGGTTG